MTFHIIGKEGNIGSAFLKHIKENYVKEIFQADVLVLCVNSSIAKEFIELYSDTKIILNFSSYKPEIKNVINGLGCSTLSVLLPLLEIQKEFVYLNQSINVVSLFPQNALSNKSPYKFLDKNIPIHTLNHNHQHELESILKKEINMSHFITPVSSMITSNISLSFSKKVDLFYLSPRYQVFTRDFKQWTIISVIDNVEEPINYMLKLLHLYTMKES